MRSSAEPRALRPHLSCGFSAATEMLRCTPKRAPRASRPEASARRASSAVVAPGACARDRRSRRMSDTTGGAGAWCGTCLQVPARRSRPQARAAWHRVRTTSAALATPACACHRRRLRRRSDGRRRDCCIELRGTRCVSKRPQFRGASSSFHPSSPQRAAAPTERPSPLTLTTGPLCSCATAAGFALG